MKKYLKTLFTFVICAVICVSCAGNKIPQEKQKVSLSDSFKNNFYIGAAISENVILEKDTRSVAILKKDFNTISPENSMKWMFLQPEPNTYFFDVSDKFVEFGEKNHMHIVGHTLIWHSQLPEFMNKINDSSEMSSHMKNHINTVVKKYKGRIHTWDVVNEALKEDGTLRESVFFNVMGERYIEQAFKLAEKADPNADLVYNDYNLCNPKKRAGVVNLVKQLQKNGAKIDGVGMQAHWNLKTPSIQEIENSIIAYSELGVKVSFTELDISVLPNPWELVGADVGQDFAKFEGDKKMDPYPTKLPDSVQIQLAKRYEDIFKLFLKHEDKISRITFWGITDKNSWLNDFPIKNRTNYPLLFDRKYQAKKAYYSIVNLKNTFNK